MLYAPDPEENEPAVVASGLYDYRSILKATVLTLCHGLQYSQTHATSRVIDVKAPDASE